MLYSLIHSVCIFENIITLRMLKNTHLTTSPSLLIAFNEIKLTDWLREKEKHKLLLLFSCILAHERVNSNLLNDFAFYSYSCALFGFLFFLVFLLSFIVYGIIYLGIKHHSISGHR